MARPINTLFTLISVTLSFLLQFFIGLKNKPIDKKHKSKSSKIKKRKLKKHLESFKTNLQQSKPDNHEDFKQAISSVKMNLLSVWGGKLLTPLKRKN